MFLVNGSGNEANEGNHTSLDKDEKAVSNLGQIPVVSVDEEEGTFVGWVSASSDWEDHVQGKIDPSHGSELQISFLNNIKEWTWCKQKTTMRNVKLVGEQKEYVHGSTPNVAGQNKAGVVPELVAQATAEGGEDQAFFATKRIQTVCGNVNELIRRGYLLQVIRFRG